jgi:hypothetical protein
MNQLREIPNISQPPNEPFRRWFVGDGLELIIWEEPVGSPIGFQLCYKENLTEKALTWINDKGYSHKRIDDGEYRPDRHKMTPVLIADGEFDKTTISARFATASTDMELSITDFVRTKLNEYSET